MSATVVPRAATTGIWLIASAPNEAAVVSAESRIEGGGSSPRARFSAVKIA